VGLVVAGTSITHHYPSQLRTLASLPASKAYLCDHHGWAPAVFDLVDWPTFHSCTLTVSFLQHLFIIKWVNDLLPFQTQQHKFNQSPSPLCPSSCGEYEDWRHFPRCPHQARALLWRSYSDIITKTFNTWEIDYAAAFVQAKLDKPVYSTCPCRYELPGHVLRLNRSLYGLRESPLNWFITLSNGLKNQGFK
jgi:hypothetical protein